MNKAEELFNQLTLKSERSGFPRVGAVSYSEGLGGYSAEWSPGQLRLKAGDPLSACFGFFRSGCLWKAGEYQEAIGSHEPKLARRFFCLEGCALTKELLYDVEEEERLRRFEALCRHIIRLGCNGILLFDAEGQLGEFYRIAGEYGLHFGARQDEKERYNSLIITSKLWEKVVARSESDQGMIKIDLLLRDVCRVREAVPSETLVIYHLPDCRGSFRFWKMFLENIPANVAVAFNAQENDPFWKVWRALARDYPGVIMPIISPSRYGGGFWPIVDACRQDVLIGANYPHLWGGAIISSLAVPTSRSLLHCELWTLSARLWSPCSASSSQLIDRWFKSFFGVVEGVDIDLLRTFGTGVRQIVDTMKIIHSEPYEQQRNFLEKSFAELKYYQNLPWKIFSIQVAHCVTDLRRMLLKKMLDCQVALSQTVIEEDIRGGFWTSMRGTPGQNARSGVEIQLLNDPIQQEPVFSDSAAWWTENVGVYELK